jgi:hypothetical protein
MRQVEFSLPPASAHFLLGLIFDLKDGGDMFLRKIGLSANYMALNPENGTLQYYSVLSIL